MTVQRTGSGRWGRAERWAPWWASQVCSMAGTWAPVWAASSWSPFLLHTLFKRVRVRARPRESAAWRRVFAGLTVSRAAAGIWAAAASHVTAAWMRATLTPANAHQQNDEDTAHDHGAHKHPLYRQNTVAVSGVMTEGTDGDAPTARRSVWNPVRHSVKSTAYSHKSNYKHGIFTTEQTRFFKATTLQS